MGSQATVVQHGYGASIPQDAPLRFFNRTGTTLVVGDVVTFDGASGQAESLNYTIGHPDSAFSQAILATTTATEGQPCYVVTKGGADNAEISAVGFGIVSASVQGAGAGSAGDLVRLTFGDKDLTTTTVGNLRPVGQLLEATAGAGAEVVRVLFWGGANWIGSSVDDVV